MPHCSSTAMEQAKGKDFFNRRSLGDCNGQRESDQCPGSLNCILASFYSITHTLCSVPCTRAKETNEV